MRNSRNAPAQRQDNRPRPPEETLITDCPIIAHPAMPPNRPEVMLPSPCPAHSRFLFDVVSVISSMMDAVIRLSSRPTIASVRA